MYRSVLGLELRLNYDGIGSQTILPNGVRLLVANCNTRRARETSTCSKQPPKTNHALDTLSHRGQRIGGNLGISSRLREGGTDEEHSRMNFP